MKWIILLLTTFSATALWAQSPSTEELLRKANPSMGRALTAHQSVKYIAVDYPGGRKRFFVGDEIVFKAKGQSGKIRDNIFAVTDSTVVFADFSEITNQNEFVEYRLDQIRKVYFMNGSGLAVQAGYLLPIAGALYFVMDFFSPVWNQEFKGAPLQLKTSTAIVSGGLFGLGALCFKSTHKALKIGNRNRLRILKTM
ncbi:hypothetical protein [Siphonobacter sp. SORGH_AS_1065]|uniref:hypothetical protein n=1 Tax=Siphonobacter sp. SORGH_AS_1065 TaxID=3041795 RepID=UPI0027D8C39F|nr:hypothetical protein [Siphonobacter sp. SORGH_AS_1065]